MSDTSFVALDKNDNLLVVLDKGENYLVSVEPSDHYSIALTAGDNYSVAIQSPSTTVINQNMFYRSADFAKIAISASFATTASYAINAGNGSGTARFILPTERYTVKSSQQAYIYDMYIYGTLDIEGGSMTLPFGNTTISNHGTLIFNDHIYNMGIVENKGIIQLL